MRRVLLLLVLVAGCESAGNPAGPSPTGSSATLLELVNRHRAAGAPCGGPVPSVALNARLSDAASAHSADMARHHYFSHVSRDGRTFQDRVAEAGYTGRALGENIAAGQSTAEAVVAAWMASPGHCQNIMRRGARQLGVGRSQSHWTLLVGVGG